jgi:hypothetical protein
MRHTDKPDLGPSGLISAQEIACFAYCPEQWRLQYAVKLPPGNRAVLDAGTRHHEHKAVAEQVASGSIDFGRVLVGVALLILIGLVLLAVGR